MNLLVFDTSLAALETPVITYEIMTRKKSKTEVFRSTLS